jgi:hypothetical protein
MSKRAAFVFAIVIALAGGLGRYLAPRLRTTRLETRRLPGFALALPDGKTVREDRDYVRGTLMIRGDGDVVVGAAWNPSDGSELSPDELAAMAQIFAGGVGKMPQGKATATSVAGPDGKPLGSLQIGDDMWMTMAMCGARQVVITTIASHGSERLHRRVVSSLACTPDPAQEAAVRQVGSALVLDLPGWFATERTPERIQLSDGQAMVSLQTVPSNIEVGDIEKVFGPLMKSQGIVATFAPPRDGRVTFSMKVDGTTAVGWVRLFHCPTRSEAVIAFAETAAVAQSVHARIGNARCRTPGEAAQAWPDSAKK